MLKLHLKVAHRYIKQIWNGFLALSLGVSALFVFRGNLHSYVCSAQGVEAEGGVVGVRTDFSQVRTQLDLATYWPTD